MCIKQLITHFLKSEKNDVIKYSELKEDEPHKDVQYTLLQCKYISHKIQISKQSESYVTITNDSIHFKDDIIKYDYISHFTMSSTRSVKIIMFTTISPDFKMIKNDSLSIIYLTFTSNNARENFIHNIFKQINTYKLSNKYDKSVHNLDAFKKTKIRRLSLI